MKFNFVLISLLSSYIFIILIIYMVFFLISFFLFFLLFLFWISMSDVFTYMCGVWGQMCRPGIRRAYVSRWPYVIFFIIINIKEIIYRVVVLCIYSELKVLNLLICE